MLTKNIFMRDGVLKKFSIILFLLGAFNIILVLVSLGQKKESAQKEVPPLIRMDLLPKKGALSSPIKRNIFAPQNTPSFPQLGTQENFGTKQALLAEAGEKREKFASGWVGHNLALRYIGYIHSPQKTIALIILSGLALAVEEGEFIEPDVKMGTITPEEIVILGPNGEQRRFSLEGEKNEKN